MRGYNPQRTNKPKEEKRKATVLTVWNGVAWTRVRSKSLSFYSDYFKVTHSKEVSKNRTEYYNEKDECVMILECP